MYKVYISEQASIRKPTSYETSILSGTILKNEYLFTNPKDLASKLGSGYTVLLSNITSKSQEFENQEFIMLDFDNKDSDNLYSIKDLTMDKFIQNNALFYYKTFSDRYSNYDKFRVVFKLNRALTSVGEVEAIYKYLFEKYPMSDTSIGQPTRLFYGGDKGYKEINFKNVLTIPDNLKIEASLSIKNNIPEVIDEQTPNYILLKYKRFDIVKKKLGKSYATSFPDIFSASNFFKGIDMVELLELPETNPFHDIFHEENSPSASVFQDNDSGVYVYKCFSESSPFTGDLFKVLYELNVANGASDCIDFMLELTSSKIDSDAEITKIKNNSQLFRKELLTGNLRKNYPLLYDYLKPYKEEINVTLDLMHDYMYIDDEGNPKYMNYFSILKLTKLVSNGLNRKISDYKMKTILNLIVVTEMITKLPESAIPKELYQKVIQPQIENEHKTRTSQVYSPNNLDENYQRNIEKIIKILKENNVTYSSLSYQLIYRLFGEKKAKQDFPQAYAPLEKKGLLVMSRDNNNLTENQRDFEKHAVKIIMTQLNTKDYIYEKDIILGLSKKLKLNEQTVRYNYNKIRADIYQKYNLKSTRLTQDLHKQLKIKEKYSSKTIITNQ